jgi:CDP-glucose 4,6-dehydratase
MKLETTKTPISHQVYKGKRVLVTGHTGFKGSWLALWLHMLGAEVTGYSLDPPSTPNHFEAARIAELLIRDVRGDIRDATLMNGTVESASPDFVFHLAAQPLVRESLISPRETFDVNVVGTSSVLDAVMKHGKQCVVIVVTSDKCYRNDETGRSFIESDPLGGHDPYSASKAGAELVVEAYRSSFFSADSQIPIHLSSVRAGNVIGGGDWGENRIIPDAVRALTRNEVLEVRNPKSVRPWQHVLESLSGYLQLASMMATSMDPNHLCSAWNFGPSPTQRVTVEDLLQKVFETWGNGKWFDSSFSDHEIEAKTLSISIGKAQHELNWNPNWDLDESIMQTMRWFQKYYSEPSQSMQVTSRNCIIDYQGSAFSGHIG